MGDHRIKDGSKRYKVVYVPYENPIRGLRADIEGDISSISKPIGQPVRLITYPTPSRDLDANGRMPICHPAAVLMRSLDKDTDVGLPQIAFGLPRGSLDIGSLPFTDEALVIRADDKDLSVDDVKAMVHFSETMCGDLLHNVTLTPQEDRNRLEAAMQRALDFMTWDKYLLAFDELRMPRPQGPMEEAFIDMRGSGGLPEYFKHGQETAEDEEVDEEVAMDESEDESDYY